MSVSDSQKADILVQALPYIQRYNGEILVVKYGGNAMINPELVDCVMKDIVLLNQIGVKTVLVHGGGPEISEMLKRVGKESKFINGLRQTDKETAEIVQMVLCGKINKNLVGIINRMGGHAMGLSGFDDGLIKAEKINEELGFVGEVKSINAKPVMDLLNQGYIPVVSSVGYDNEGNVYNINADTVASSLAAELKAGSLISMTDIKGILRDKNDDSSLIPVITVDEAPALIESGVINGGMIPKVECCIDAIKGGVKRVFIIDGRVPHSILIEVLSDEGIGTMFH